MDEDVFHDKWQETVSSTPLECVSRGEINSFELLLIFAITAQEGLFSNDNPYQRLCI